MSFLPKNITAFFFFLSAGVIGANVSAASKLESLYAAYWGNIEEIGKGKGNLEKILSDLTAYGDLLDAEHLSRQLPTYQEMILIGSSWRNLRLEGSSILVRNDLISIASQINVHSSNRDDRYIRMMIRQIEYLRKRDPKVLSDDADCNGALQTVLENLGARDFAGLSQPALAFLRGLALDKDVNIFTHILAQAIVVYHDPTEDEIVRALDRAWRVIRSEPSAGSLVVKVRDALVKARPERCFEYLSHDGKRTPGEQALHDMLVEFYGEGSGN